MHWKWCIIWTDKLAYALFSNKLNVCFVVFFDTLMLYLSSVVFICGELYLRDTLLKNFLMSEIKIDALLPVEMATRAEYPGVRKAETPSISMFMLSLLVGAFICCFHLLGCVPS